MSLLGLGQQGITLKELLENPDLQNPPQLKKDGNNLKKTNNVVTEGYDFSSAFLGPNLWNTNTSDDDYKLEYMDLDEFLSENGIPTNIDDNSNSSTSSIPLSSTLDQSPPLPKKSQVINEDIDKFMPLVSLVESEGSQSPVQIDISIAPSSPNGSPKVVTLSSPPLSPQHSEGSCSPVHVDVDFDVPETDLALVSVPGCQDGFDPKRRHFSEEELKPQPIIKKSKKVFVPDDHKDDKYWCRRKKNNVAAKRSRDARRIKENQIAMRAAFLEKENSKLKEELEKMKKENTKLKETVQTCKLQAT